MKKLVSLLLALALLVSMSSVAFAAKEDFDPSWSPPRRRRAS